MKLSRPAAGIFGVVLVWLWNLPEKYNPSDFLQRMIKQIQEDVPSSSFFVEILMMILVSAFVTSFSYLLLTIWRKVFKLTEMNNSLDLRSKDACLYCTFEICLGVLTAASFKDYWNNWTEEQQNSARELLQNCEKNGICLQMRLLKERMETYYSNAGWEEFHKISPIVIGIFLIYLARKLLGPCKLKCGEETVTIIKLPLDGPELNHDSTDTSSETDATKTAVPDATLPSTIASGLENAEELPIAYEVAGLCEDCTRKCEVKPTIEFQMKTSPIRLESNIKAKTMKCKGISEHDLQKLLASDTDTPILVPRVVLHRLPSPLAKLNTSSNEVEKDAKITVRSKARLARRKTMAQMVNDEVNGNGSNNMDFYMDNPVKEEREVKRVSEDSDTSSGGSDTCSSVRDGSSVVAPKSPIRLRTKSRRQTKGRKKEEADLAYAQ